jgi:hypothetical protein
MLFKRFFIMHANFLALQSDQRMVKSGRTGYRWSKVMRAFVQVAICLHSVTMRGYGPDGLQRAIDAMAGLDVDVEGTIGKTLW